MTAPMPRVEPLPALTATSPGVPFTWLTVALLAMASAGQIEISMAPFILSMIVDHYRVSETVGLFVIGLQLGGFALTALLVSGWVGRSRRGGMKHARLAVGLGLLSQLVSLLPVGVSVLAIARLTAGVAEGATVAIAYAIISRMENFSRMLAIQGGVMAAGVVGMLLLVPLADAEFGPVGLFVPLMMVAALTLPLTFALPTDHEAVTRAEHKGPVSRGIAVVALVAVSLSAASNTLWLFMDQIGTRDGLSLSAISRVTALSAASCVAAPYFAYHSRRLSGSIAPIILLCIVQAGFGWFFTHTRSSAIYVVTSFGLNLTYAWCMVSVRIASADYDATGRAPSAVAGAESFGLVIGPLLAGLATSIWPGYATIGILAGAGFAVAGMAVVWFGRIGSFR